MEEKVPALLALNPHEARTAAALFERLFPADEHGPGATEIGVLTYVDRALAGPYKDKTETYRLGLAALDRAALNRYSVPLSDCNTEQQNALIAGLEEGTLPDFKVPPQHDFFKMLRDHLQEGLFADPAHGGNRDKLGWKLLGHPGIWFENSAEENLSEEPVTKGGEVRSLADLGYSLGGAPSNPAEIPGYDPQMTIVPPIAPEAVVLLGVGAMSGLVA